jgi:diguanylate cyclase (GGDEF)-like protein
VAEKLRLTTSIVPVALGPSEEGPALAVTVSIGATMMESARGEDVYALLEAADRALYEAKRGGRNRVTARAVDH